MPKTTWVSPCSARAGPEAAEHLLEALRIREALRPVDDLDLATSSTMWRLNVSRAAITRARCPCWSGPK
jgi:hypothetical protein